MSAGLSIYQSVLGELGVKLGAPMALLDFGCGDGALVREALRQGIDAFGCDVEMRPVDADAKLLERLVAIEFAAPKSSQWAGQSPGSGAAYRLPFPDESFDVVISDQVFEHVHNYPEVNAEIHRVLRRGGAFLHFSPSRYSLLEPHIYVPMAACFHPRWWLGVWAKLGLRNEFQNGMPATAVARTNAEFMSKMTNYLDVADLRREFSRGFRCKFVEREFMRHSRRARWLLLPWIYRTFKGKCVFGVKH